MKKLEPLLFVIGVALLGILLYHFGIANLVENIQRAGVWILAVVAFYIPIYALNTQVWRLVLGKDRRRFSWAETFNLTVSAFALNYITPLVMLGGEPYRAYALTPRVDASTAVSSVVLFRLLHTLAHLLTWVIALGMAFFLLPLSPWLVAALALTGIVLVGAIVLLFHGPQNGSIGRFLGAMQHARWLGPLGQFLAAKQPALAKMNSMVVDFYRRRRAVLIAGIALECLVRVLVALEVYIILRSVQIDLNPVLAFFVYSASSLFTNIFFFMPLELGVKEGSLYFILGSLGLASELGIFIGVVGRIREIFWIVVGLVFLLIQGQRRWIWGKAPIDQEATMTMESLKK